MSERERRGIKMCVCVCERDFRKSVQERGNNFQSQFPYYCIFCVIAFELCDNGKKNG